MSRHPLSRIIFCAVLSSVVCPREISASETRQRPAAPPPAAAPDEFHRSLEFYNRRVREGASTEERLFILEKMEKRYAGRPADLELVRAEKERIRGNTLAEINRSWNFYQRRVREGAAFEERLFILSKIEARHPRAGNDLQAVRDERKAVEELQRLERLSGEFRAEWDQYKDRAALWGDEEERLARLNQWEAKYAELPEAGELIRAERRRIAPDYDAFRRAPSAGRRKLVKGFMRVDTWFREEVYEQDQEDAKASLPGYLAIGYDSASADVKDTGGLGMRGGIFWLSRTRPVAMGGSVGYVLGPEEEVLVNAVSAVAEDGRQQKRVESDFMRVLFELQTRTPLTRRTELRIGGGVGLAKGRIRQNTGNSGSFVSSLQYPFNQSNTKRWDGVTWEVAPALAFLGNSMQMEIGLAYAVFPEMASDANFDPFRWSPLGLHVKFEY